MMSIVQNWLDEPGLSHVQACSVRLPGGQRQTQVVGGELTNEDFERAIDQVASIVSLLAAEQLLPGQVTLNFAHGRLHYVVRPDHAVLGLYCRLEPDADSSAVAQLIGQFLLEPSGAAPPSDLEL